MDKKWYNLFVSVDQPSEETPANEAAPGNDQPPDAPKQSAAQTIAEIAATTSVVEPKLTAPVGDAASFDEIYRAAEIPDASHGYTILKISDMLQSEYIRSLAPAVKRSSVLLALEAAGVKIQDVIQDAVRRDRALDTYERLQEKALHELEARMAQENGQVQAELDRLVAEHQARIKKNNDGVAKEKERFFGWRLKKQQEEQKIYDAVSYFAAENPITAGGVPKEPPAPPKPQG